MSLQILKFCSSHIMLDNALKLSLEVMVKSLGRSLDFRNGWYLRRMLFMFISLKKLSVFTRVPVKH